MIANLILLPKKKLLKTTGKNNYFENKLIQIPRTNIYHKSLSIILHKLHTHFKSQSFFFGGRSNLFFTDLWNLFSWVKNSPL